MKKYAVAFNVSELKNNVPTETILLELVEAHSPEEAVGKMLVKKSPAQTLGAFKATLVDDTAEQVKSLQDQVKTLETLLHNKQFNIPNDRKYCENYAYISVFRHNDRLGLTVGGLLPMEDVQRALKMHSAIKGKEDDRV